MVKERVNRVILGPGVAHPHLLGEDCSRVAVSHSLATMSTDDAAGGGSSDALSESSVETLSVGEPSVPYSSSLTERSGATEDSPAVLIVP